MHAALRTPQRRLATADVTKIALVAVRRAVVDVVLDIEGRGSGMDGACGTDLQLAGPAYGLLVGAGSVVEEFVAVCVGEGLLLQVGRWMLSMPGADVGWSLRKAFVTASVGPSVCVEG